MSGRNVLTKSSPSLCSLPLYVASSSTSEAFIFKKVFKSLSPAWSSFTALSHRLEPALLESLMLLWGLC